MGGEQAIKTRPLEWKPCIFACRRFVEGNERDGGNKGFQNLR